MKKFMIFAVSMLMSTTAFAIDFDFAPVTKVAQSGKNFYAYSDDGYSVAISGHMYDQINAVTDGYFILSINDKEIVAAGDEFVVEELMVEEVIPATDGEKVKVLFTSGQKLFQNPEWLKAKKGQRVRRVYINTFSWEFENYSTIDEPIVGHVKTKPTKKVTQTQNQTQAPAPGKSDKKQEDAKKTAQEIDRIISNLSFSITN